MDAGEGQTADTRELLTDPMVELLSNSFPRFKGQVSLFQRPVENYTAIYSGIWESSKNLRVPNY